MSEVSFAKSYLATIDKRPIKLAADHVSDARHHPNQSPYTLPRQPHPFPRRDLSSNARPKDAPKVTVMLRAMRGGETVAVADVLPGETTVHDLKMQYAQQTGAQLEKVKLLMHKKPVAELKLLTELGVKGEQGTVEMSVMIMGAGSAASSPVVEKRESAVTPAAQTEGEKMDVDSAPPAARGAAGAEEKEKGKDKGKGTGKVGEVLSSEEFWRDCEAFVESRVGEGDAFKVTSLFRDAWKHAGESQV